MYSILYNNEIINTHRDSTRYYENYEAENIFVPK